MFPINEFQYLESPDVIEDVAGKLREILMLADRCIRFFSGVAHWMLYSHPFIVDTLRQKKAAGIKIDFIAGPALSIWPAGEDLEERSSGVLDLAEDGIINLFYRYRLEDASQHFVIIDDRLVLAEEPHAPLSRLLTRKVHILKGKDICRAFQILFDDFLDSDKARLSQKPREDFTLMSPSEIAFQISGF
ncbi:MAG: hypothetical protein PHF35_01365 [Candidatus Moranbacteria bacterium]|nr:hypothetical protein [Candidatus Moranbacteria bacterium]